MLKNGEEIEVRRPASTEKRVERGDGIHETVYRVPCTVVGWVMYRVLLCVYCVVLCVVLCVCGKTQGLT